MRNVLARGRNYAFLLPVGGLVEPPLSFLPKPETKRRMKNLIEVTGLLTGWTAKALTGWPVWANSSMHPESYLEDLKLYRMTRVVFLACTFWARRFRDCQPLYRTGHRRAFFGSRREA